MNPTVLLQQAEQMGATFTVTPAGLHVERPQGPLPPDILAALKKHKDEIRAELTKRQYKFVFPHVERLLNWASNLSEQKRVLHAPVKFLEAPLTPVQVELVSDYAARQLRTIISARIHTDAGGWDNFTPEWWQDRKDDALAALAALRDALEGSQT